MRRREFSRLVDSLPSLSPFQLRHLTEQVNVLAERSAVRELVAQRETHMGGCPHCGTKQYWRWGKTPAGEQRFRCRGCKKTFTLLTGTAFENLHHKSLLLMYVACMRDGLSVRKTAERLGLHRNVVYRWRKRLMPALKQHQPSVITGVAEVDEAYFRRSYKGRKRGMPRKAYKRGTPASKRGISSEQVPVVTAISRGSRDSHITVLAAVPTTAAVADALGPALARDVVLCADSGGIYKPMGDRLGITVRQIPSGSHKLGPYHIQNVNALHSRMKGWLSQFRGVATHNLPLYLAWFRFFDRNPQAANPRQFLLDAMGVPDSNTPR